MKRNSFSGPRKTIGKYSTLAFAIQLAGQVSAQSPASIEEVSIVGNAEEASRSAGAVHFISPEQLAVFSYSDIQRILREVPGVYVQIEDGFGLRPNLSIRGVASERSSRITLLEDNVLIAPAPYAAPAAYYFPTSGRMHAVEVVKGPSAITQGPYTTGGALNMVSTPIPASKAGYVLAETGQNSSNRLHAWYGGFSDNGFGALLETHLWESDGFQTIDRSNRDTGLSLQDYTLKLAYAPIDSAHSIELKLQATNQDSNQSYLGLADADFSASPYRRYGLSELDNIQTEHTQAILRYGFNPSENTGFTAVIYRNDHARNWFKTEGMDFDGSNSVAELSRTSWSSIIDSINNGVGRGAYSAAQLMAIMDGSMDTPFGSIASRANNRDYYSKGVQLGFQWQLNQGAVTHELSSGLRYHEDAEDRFQHDTSWQQLDGRLVFNAIGEAGGAGNQIQQAEAFSAFLQDTISIGNWQFTPGIRYEDIDQQRVRFNGAEARNFRDKRTNTEKVWLPGFGVTVQVADSLRLIAGVHKGFSAPSNQPGQKAEQSYNYETGFRFASGNTRLELIGFYSNYENLVGVCTASSGVDCVVGDTFNGDAATVKGTELQAATTLETAGLQFPLSFTWTWTDGQFDSDIADTGFFGDVSKGDPIPYLPGHQWRLSAGIGQESWDLNLSLNFIDEVCVSGGCNAFERTDATLITDLSANYRFSPVISFYGRVENLADTAEIMGRQPYGARPNRGRTALAGVRMQF